MSAFTDNSNCHDISNDNGNDNGFNGNEDKQRCSEYQTQLVPEFVDITRENISKRIKELCYIINQNTFMVRLNTHNNYSMGNNHSNNIEFVVNALEFVNLAMAEITPVIQKHTIVQLGACKKIPKSKNEYKKVARNRLNRNKPKFLGNFVFAPLIFDKLYQFCGNIFRANQMVVFVSILEDILSPTAVVRFEQTRAQPLIPYNTFVMENKFKNSCITLLRYYKLAKQWEIGSKKPNGKKETAKDVWNCFRAICLPKVAERCRNFNNTTPPNNLISNTIQFTTQNPIIPNSPNHNNTNIIYDRQSNDGMEYEHKHGHNYNDNNSEHQSMDDNSTQMSISTVYHQQQQQQELQQPMYPTLRYGDNSNSARCTVPYIDNSNSARCTVPYIDNNNNNNNNNLPPQIPYNLSLQANNSYQSNQSSSYIRSTPHSMHSSTINSSGLPSPVSSSRFSSRRGSMMSSNNDNLPPAVSMGNRNNNNNNNNGNDITQNSFSVMAIPNDNNTNNDYGGNDIMNNNNNTQMRPNTNNDNQYGYTNTNSSSTNAHLQNNNNYGHITNNVYHQYNINQNNDNTFQNCDNMTTSSNNSSNSSNSDNTANSSNPSIENANNSSIQMINTTLTLPPILRLETSGDFMMNSPMTMGQFNSPLANHNTIDMMIMSPMTTNNMNNGGTNWMPNIENTDFDYNTESNQINSSFATFP